jgi:hypothetical protein
MKEGYLPHTDQLEGGLIVALNGCAAAPDRFAVLRLEVYGSIGPLFPKGMRTQHHSPEPTGFARRAALSPGRYPLHRTGCERYSP